MKNVIRKLIAPGLGLSLLFTGGTASALESGNVYNSFSTIKPVVETSDMLASNKGKGKDKDEKAREKFVKATVEHAYNVVGQGKYNVVVAGPNNGLLWNANSKHYKNYSVMYGSETYFVWLHDYLMIEKISNDKKSEFGFKGNCHKESNQLVCLWIGPLISN